MVYIPPKVLSRADNHQLCIKLLWIVFSFTISKKKKGKSLTLGATFSTDFVREDSDRKMKFTKENIY